MACCTSSRVGWGFRLSRALADINCPEVQNPHCGASCSIKAFCSGSRSPEEAKPSTVVIFFPSSQTASWLHDFTVLPSTMTVQAPHSPALQPIFVPVNPR